MPSLANSFRWSGHTLANLPTVTTDLEKHDALRQQTLGIGLCCAVYVHAPRFRMKSQLHHVLCIHVSLFGLPSQLLHRFDVLLINSFLRVPLVLFQAAASICTACLDVLKFGMRSSFYWRCSRNKFNAAFRELFVSFFSLADD